MIRRWSLRIVALASNAAIPGVASVDALRGFPSDGFYLLAQTTTAAVAPKALAIWLRPRGVR